MNSILKTFGVTILLSITSIGFSAKVVDKGKGKTKIETKKSCVKACQAPTRKTKK